MRCGWIGCLASLALFVTGCSTSHAPDAQACTSGATRSCYSGAAGTKGVGTCTAGVSTCGANHEWSLCAGEVVPHADLCGNALDENCNGVADEVPDPSAFDFPGNGADDDCNGGIDDVASCGGGLPSNSSSALDFASALDVCAMTTTSATTGFGVIRGAFTLADGTGAPALAQHALRTSFGTGITPRAGVNFAILSTGKAAATGDTNPSFSAVDPGTQNASTSAFPSDWLSANGGSVPVTAGCPPLSGVLANDPILLTLTLRVPDNAHAVAFDSFFLSADYPEYACSPLTDVFLVLLDSTFAGSPPNPVDKNIARGTDPTITASCAHSGTCPFAACVNGATGCAAGAVASTWVGCTGSSSLVGTGFDAAKANQCNANSLSGGGTGWMTAAGNVVPGETITLRFSIWDTSDGTLDSDVVLDNLRWLPATITPGLQ